jgi:hypothetical protein
MHVLLCRTAIAVALSALAGCGKLDQLESVRGRGIAAASMAPAAAPHQALAEVAAKTGSSTDAGAATQRYLAVRHELQLQTEADAVETAWKSASQACDAASCELIASTLARDDERLPTQATLEARVPHGSFDAFLARVTALGVVGRHAVSAEDKTGEVIDAEARAKNMTEFRDRLRSLMQTPGAKLKDLIDVERELARVQGDIDSLAGRRKLLAGETERVHVVVAFSAKPAVLAGGTWAPVHDAVLDIGRSVARSLAGLIWLVTAALPWALLLLAAFLAVRTWRRRRGRAQATPQT